MNGLDYFHSISQEFKSLQNRIRHFIGNNHWLTDGEWKESILRNMLKRHLSENIGIGKGFVITEDGPTNQIDVLIYEKNYPILYKEGDLILVTPDAFIGMVEVKTSLNNNELKSTINKMQQNSNLIFNHCNKRILFTGIFVFNDCLSIPFKEVLEEIKVSSIPGLPYTVNSISIGTDRFFRFWDRRPEPDRKNEKSCWRAYEINDLAPAYFIHNLLENICWPTVSVNKNIWYPDFNKEEKLIEEVEAD